MWNWILIIKENETSSHLILQSHSVSHQAQIQCGGNGSPDDEGMVVHDTSASIQGLGGPMTRSRTKKVKEALTQLVAKVLESKPTL
ncbi:hypothetical protein MTR_3g074710 [Medicago truncatula]|uniref:Uncharacterized protein n=1 Tax=Medicago truncatula TaxID=3880 RepID=A0A072V0Q6_MEDTR|nr:hypothetical protein MTR_3g074710 [Medicago truncatula]